MINTRVNLHDHTKEMLDGNELRINLIVTIILIVIDVSLLIQVFTNTAAANVTVFCGVPAILLSLVIVLNLVFSRHLHHWVKNVNMIVMLVSFMLVGEINHSEFFMLFIVYRDQFRSIFGDTVGGDVQQSGLQPWHTDGRF